MPYHWTHLPLRPHVNRAHHLNQGLLAAWLFWQHSGVISTDVASNNLLQQNSTWTGGRISRSGGLAVTSDGVNGFGTMSRVPKLGTGDFSIFAWINKSGTGARRGIVSYGATSTANGVNLYVNNTDKLAFDLSNVGGPVSSSTISADTWVMVGCTCISGVVQLYVDLAKDGSSSSMSPNITDPGSSRGFIARDFSPATFSGSIGEVRIWGRGLTPKDVVDLWASNYDEFRLPGPVAWNLASAPIQQSAVSMM